MNINLQLTKLHDWFGTPLGKIAETIVIAIILIVIVRPAVHWFIKKITARTQKLLNGHADLEGHLRQTKTLVRFINSIIIFVVVAIAVFTVLDALGVDVRPLIASAGVIGLAIGFGAQSLVKDLVSGFFITLERYYVIGDDVDIDGFRGTIMQIGLRSTVLQGKEGDLRFVPNGTITKVTNYSRVVK